MGQHYMPRVIVDSEQQDTSITTQSTWASKASHDLSDNCKYSALYLFSNTNLLLKL